MQLSLAQSKHMTGSGVLFSFKEAAYTPLYVHKNTFLSAQLRVVLHLAH